MSKFPLSKQKQSFIALILAASFLVETFLSAFLYAAFPFLSPLVYIVTNIAFYAALVGCFLITLIPNITWKEIVKAICLVVAFFMVEQIISVFLFLEVLALGYEIVRPLLLLAVLLFGSRWVLKSKLCINKLSWILLGGVFLFGVLFHALDYIQLMSTMENMGDNFASYLNMLTSANSVYNIVATLCTYIFIFILFVRQPFVCQKNKDA